MPAVTLPHSAARRLLTAVSVLAVLLAVVVPGAAAQSRADLEDIEDRIEAAEQRIEQLDAQRQATVEEFEAVNAELLELQDQLALLNAELARAQAQLDERERALAATTAELQATEQRLADTRAQLETNRARWEASVRESYIQGRPGPAIPVFEIADPDDLAHATQYMQAIVAHGRRGYEQIGVLQTQIEADEAALERLRTRQDAERRAAQAERDHVAELVAVQEALVTQVQAQADAKRALLAQLEADRSSAEHLIANLEAESARIEQELAARAASPSAIAPSGSGQFLMPTSGPITSGFGYRVHPISGVRRLHAGIDIGAPTGQPIYASAAGTVVSAGVRGGYGNAVVIDHGGGFATLYAHQSRVAASPGQSVSQGQVIGYVGSTGYSTGPHLHFEIRVNGTPQNPMNYL